MTKTDIESIKATIAKLITLANNPGATENESRVAMDRAQKLMAKYELDEAEILRQKIKQGVKVEAVREDADCYYVGKYYMWEFRLGWDIAKIFDVYAIKTWNNKEFNWEKSQFQPMMSFLGMPNDLSLVLYFFDYCQNEIARHMELAYPTQQKQNSFAEGMVNRIIERLQVLYTRYKAEVQASTTDIVVFKKDAIQEAKDLHFPDRQKGKSRRRLLANEFHKGREAGKYVHLSSNLRQVQNNGS